MTEKQKKILRWIYDALITAALLTAGVCLMVACVGIYRINPDGHPFTRTVVAQYFAPIALPVYLCVALAVVGFFLRPLLPKTPAPKADVTLPTLKRLTARTDLALCPTELRTAIEKERRTRRLHCGIALVLLAVGAAIFLVYALDVNHFHISAITPAIKAAMGWLLPCMGIPFACGVAAAYLNRASVRREIALLKTAPTKAVSPAAAAPVGSERWVILLRCVLAAVALLGIAVGAADGGWLDVLTKAINICTECIGLG